MILDQPKKVQNSPIGEDHAQEHAIIAAEDGGFYDHSGVEITSLMRGFYGEITGRSLGGGGTITMQVVRNYVLSFERTYIRKLREIITNNVIVFKEFFHSLFMAITTVLALLILA